MASTVMEIERALTGIAAKAGEHDRDGSFPHEAFDRLHDAGALALTVPVALGGGGAGLAPAGHVVEAVGGADPSVALVLSQHLLFHANLPAPTTHGPLRCASGSNARQSRASR